MFGRDQAGEDFHAAAADRVVAGAAAEVAAVVFVVTRRSTHHPERRDRLFEKQRIMGDALHRQSVSCCRAIVESCHFAIAAKSHRSPLGLARSVRRSYSNAATGPLPP